MNGTIIDPPEKYPIDRVKSGADILNKDADDWEFRVVDCGDGLGRIDVYDEEKYLIHEGMRLI